jgi:hypothetical protein
MKNLLLILLLVGTFACGEQTASTQKDTEPATSLAEAEEKVVEEETPNIEPETTTPTPEEELSSDITGMYVGEFEATKFRENRRPSYVNKITIAIDRLEGDSIFGRSIVAGNYRPFKGTFEEENANGMMVYNAKVSEPGDDRYDGKFEFTAIPNDQKVMGTWIANNSRLAVSERSYKLEKRTFEYNPDLALPENVSWTQLYDRKASDEYTNEGEFLTEDVLALNASNTLLKKEDVENMYKGDLEIIRNTIYARHGYSFKNRKLRYIFDSFVDWYMPISTDIRSKLTDVEKKNIDLLKRYEQHADRYYDVFGR